MSFSFRNISATFTYRHLQFVLALSSRSFLLAMVFGVILFVLLINSGSANTYSHKTAHTDSTYTDEILQNLSTEVLNKRAFLLTSISPHESLILARRALQQAGQEGKSREQARALSTIGVVLRFQDKYDSALVVLTAARKLFEQIHDTIGLADVYMFISGVHQSRGNYTGVMENGYWSLEFSEKLKDSHRIARAFANIGTGYTLKQEYTQALEFQRKAFQMRSAQNDSFGIAHSLRNMGVIFEEMNQPDSALGYFQRSLAAFTAIHNTQGITLALGSLGTCYEKLNNSAKALEYLFRVIPQFEELGDRRGSAVTHNAVARAYCKQKRFNEALFHAEQGLNISENIGALVEQREALFVLAEVSSALGNEHSAFGYFRRFVAIKDSIANFQNLQRIAELQGRYDLEQQRRERSEAEHQRNLARMNAETLRNSLIAATIIFIGIVAAVANGYRLKRRSEKILRQQNEEILRQQEQLRRQAEEISETNTQLHETNALLEQSNSTLVQLNHEKNEFLGIAAHDLKNPLHNILLTTQLIEEFRDKVVGNKMQEWTQSISRSVEYMLNIISNLLDVNKIEAGKVEMEIEPIRSGLVDLIVDAYAFRAQEKDIVMELEPQRQEMLFLADRNALQQILENLISNALKFSPPKTTVRVRVRTGLQSPNTIRVEIQDEGPGISEDDRKKLFGKFARLSAQPTGGEHSTGLGLSIVKKMVEAMNGTVWCESELGKGSTFIIELPAIQP